MNKTVAIVGSHPATMSEIPWTRKGIDFWVFNEAANPAPQFKKGDEIIVGDASWVQKVDAVFQMHRPYIYKNKLNRNDLGHWEWLQKEHPFPIYMLEADPSVPNSTTYPMDEIREKLLPKDRFRRGRRLDTAEECKVFTSSPAYALALAILFEYKRIELYGVEMVTHTEYFAQRDMIMFWLGYALGKGIEVVVGKNSTLFNSLYYGYEGDIGINKQEFESAFNNYSKQAVTFRDQCKRKQGEVEGFLKQALDGETQEKKNEAFNKYLNANKEWIAMIEVYGKIQGARDENSRYLQRVDSLIQAAGGSKAEEMVKGGSNGVGETQQPAELPA